MPCLTPFVVRLMIEMLVTSLPVPQVQFIQVIYFYNPYPDIPPLPGIDQNRRHILRTYKTDLLIPPGCPFLCIKNVPVLLATE